MSWQSEFHKSFIFGLKEENTLETKSKASFGRIGSEYKEADGRGRGIMVYFNLPSVRGSAKSTVHESQLWYATGEIILEVEVLSSAHLILQSVRAILIVHNIVMDARAGTSVRSPSQWQRTKGKRLFRTVTSSETLSHFDIAWFHKHSRGG